MNKNQRIINLHVLPLEKDRELIFSITFKYNLIIYLRNNMISIIILFRIYNSTITIYFI